ncbi:alpha/beta hydrolase [Pedobacter agri]|uniref:alpha/beta hydrolase n=1 Tax=Pedobacter agri TaxID=454586 RepID=UPI00293051A2|nr:alpha/beta hydrolase [Pedobacter agri]
MKILTKTFLLVLCAVIPCIGIAQTIVADNLNKKVFPVYEDIIAKKVSFVTRLGIHISADLYMLKGSDLSKKHPAIIVGHPFGGVKEQTSGFYAQEMARYGFITLAFDLERYGESGGEPRNVASPEGFVEDYMAAMDFMGTRSFIDSANIGGIGICASGSLIVAAASIDPRYKAIATVSMNDLGRSRRQGINDVMTRQQLKEVIAKVALQRWDDVKEGKVTYVPGAPEKIDQNSNVIATDFFDYYRTGRGRHPRATTNTSDNSISSFLLFHPYELIDLVSPRPLLFITGEKAYTRYINEDAYKLASQPKELVIIPGATHVDLYDRTDLIPFNKLKSFFESNLK